MALPEIIAAKLAQPLDPKRVHKREGSGGRQLSYLEAHDVIRAANSIFGIGEWGYEVQQLDHLGTEQVTGRDNKPGHRVAYRAIVRVSFNGHCFSDVGYGDAVEYGQSALTQHELAAKEAVSDAVKRCLKNYGDQFGLCLYDKDAPEHRSSQGTTAGGRSQGADSASAPPADGEFRFPSGKHKGKTLAEAGTDYCAWYLENGPRDDVKNAIRAASSAPGPTLEDAWDTVVANEDIPF